MPGFSSQEYVHATRLAVATPVTFAAGTVQLATPGAPVAKARDTLLHRVFIPLNATAITVTITGLSDSAGVAASLVLTGQTTVDTTVVFDVPLLNEFAQYTFTASIANLAWVFTRDYTGP
jgi:hypothetical protein